MSTTGVSSSQCPIECPAHDGTDIVIRPMWPEDAEIKAKFVRALSSEATYFRFMNPLQGQVLGNNSKMLELVASLNFKIQNDLDYSAIKQAEAQLHP